MPEIVNGITVPVDGDPINLPGDLKTFAEGVGASAQEAGAAAAVGYASSLDDAKVSALLDDPGTETASALSASIAQVGGETFAPVITLAAALGTGADDRAAIQSALDAVPVGGGVVQGDPRKLYRVGKAAAGAWALQLTRSGTILRDVRVKLLDAAPDNVAVIRGDNLTDVRIENVEVDGNNARGAMSVGNEGEGINLKSCTRATLRRVYAHHCGQDGIDLDDVTDAVVDSCVLTDNYGNGLHASGSGLFARQLTVTNCVTRNNAHERKALGTLEGFAGIDVAGGDVSLIGNHSENDAEGLAVRYCARATIQGNTVKTPGTVTVAGPAIKIGSASTGVSVTGNTIFNRGRNTVGGHGVLITDASTARITVTGNTIAECDNAVFAAVGTNITIAANTISGSNSGVRVAAGVTAWLVQGNNITDSNWAIRALANDGLIVGNVILGAVEQGIDLFGPVTVAVLDNLVLSATKYALRMFDSGGAPVGCTVRNNVLTGTLGAIQTAGNSHRVDHFGAGTPEGAIHAGVGSRWARTDGAAGTSLYVKETGTGTTGWVAK